MTKAGDDAATPAAMRSRPGPKRHKLRYIEALDFGTIAIPLRRGYRGYAIAGSGRTIGSGRCEATSLSLTIFSNLDANRSRAGFKVSATWPGRIGACFTHHVDVAAIARDVVGYKLHFKCRLDQAAERASSMARTRGSRNR